METKAKYVSIGLFTLLVTAGIFGFVYWLHNVGGMGQRAIYKVRYSGSVSGLLAGSSVLFNGVRVGTVTALDLDAKDPQEVLATIAIDPATPVRSDTAAGLDFQGLTGAPVIVLTGGSGSASALAASDGTVPVLTAPPGAGLSLTQSARDTLGQMDKIMSDNSTALRDAISNISSFSQALSRNSDRVDGIMSGLERMTGGSKARSVQYSLTAPYDIAQCERSTGLVLALSDPGGLMGLNSDKIPVIGTETPPEFAKAQFTDNLPQLMQAKVIESLENTRCFKSVSRPIDGVEPDAQIILDIRNFNVVLQPKAEAAVDLSARFASKGKLVGAQTFREKAALANLDATSAVTALDTAFGKGVKALAAWAVQMAAQMPPPVAQEELEPAPEPAPPAASPPQGKKP